MKIESFKHLVPCLVMVCQLAQAQLENGLVSYYSFEADFSNHIEASGPDGIAMNGALAGIEGGRSGNAMALSTDTNQHMNLGLGFGEGTDLGMTFSISAWYNINTPPAANAAIRYFVFEGADAYDVSYGVRDLGLGEPGIDDGQVFTQGSSINIADAALDGWQHVLQTYTPVEGTVVIETYINGAAVGSISIGVADLFDSGLNFGAARNTVTNRGFDGLIDEVAIWDRALTGSEIASVYALGLNSKPVIDANPPATAPTIVSFTADPSVVSAGSMSTLSWEVTGATSVTLSGGIGNVALADSLMVTVEGPTAYTLVAINENSIQTAEATITITVPPVDILRGLVGYYDFESGIADQSGSPITHDGTYDGIDPLAITETGAGFAGDATYEGAVATNSTDRSTLLVGNALNIAGNAGGGAGAGAFAVSTLNTATLGNQFSISAWFFVAADADTGDQRHFVFEANDNYDVSFGTGTVTGEEGNGTFTSYVGQDGAPVTNSLAQGVWHHVLHSFSTSGPNTSMQVYINGVNTTSEIVATTAVNFPGLNFGMHRAETGRVLDGMMDDIGVWDRALSEEEIALAFELGSNGIGIKGPVAGLAITSISYDADTGDATIEFISVAGATYSIDSSSELVGWDELTDNFKATSDRSSYTENTNDPRSFFRVRRN